MVLALAIVTSVLVARVLGPDGRGISAAAWSLAMLLVQFTNLGLHSSATYLAGRDRRLVPALLGNTLVVGVAGGSAVSVVAWLGVHLLSIDTGIEGALLLAALVAVPCILSYTLLLNLALGVGLLRVYNGAEAAVAGVTLLLLASAAVAGQLSPTMIPIASAAASAFGSLIVLLGLLRGFRPRLGLHVLAESLRLGWRPYIVCLTAYIVSRADLLLVSGMAGAASAGQYAVAQSMAALLLMPATVVATILFPRLAGLSDFESKWRLTSRAALMTAAMMGPGLAAVYVFTGELLTLLFGAEYRAAAAGLRALLPGVLLLGVETVAVQLLNSLGFPVTVVALWLSAAIMNIGLNVIVIPPAGYVGAAWVSSTTYAFQAAAIVGLVWSARRRARRESPHAPASATGVGAAVPSGRPTGSD